MKLLKCAYKIGDKNLITQALKVLALKRSAVMDKKILEKIADVRGGLTPEQRDFWAKIEEYLLKIFKNQAWKVSNNRAMVEDLIGEATMRVLELLEEKDIANADMEDQERFVRYMISVGNRHIKDKAEGSRRGKGRPGSRETDYLEEGEYTTDYSNSGIAKPVHDDPLPYVIKEVIDSALREAGFSRPFGTSDEQVKFIIEENMDEIQRVYDQWAEKQKQKKIENLMRRNEGRKERGYDPIEMTEKNTAPTPLEKILQSYTGRLRGYTDPMFSSPSSLDAPAIMGEESSDESISDRISVNSLLTLLGAADVGGITEDIVMRKEIMNELLPVIYQIPVPYRLIMAAHFEVPLDLLQSGQELTNAAKNAAYKAGLEATESPEVAADIADQVLNAMKTKAGTRLSWAATKRFIESAYGDEILQGMNRVEDFEETLRGYWRELLMDYKD